MHVRQATQIKVVGGQAFGWLALGAFDFCKLQLRCNRADNARRDAVLKSKNVVESTLEPFGPEVHTACSVDQLAIDANTLAGLSHAAFQDVSNAKIATHLLGIHGAALVSEGRVPRDDEEPLNA